MNRPRFQIGDVVGYADNLYWVAGVSVHFGYNFTGWQYYLLRPAHGDAGQGGDPFYPSNQYNLVSIGDSLWHPEDKVSTKAEFLAERKRKLEAQMADMEKQRAALQQQIQAIEG